MRIAVLPIDSRPCNTQFIERLAGWAHGEVVLPGKEAMDWFRNPAPYEGSREFLEAQLARCDAAVISLDHWCFGSLLASREDQISTELALSRVAELRQILLAHPDVPVYMSTIIMRSSISTLSSDDLDAYYAMTEYSVHSDRFERFALPEDAEKAAKARKRIPDAVLDKVFRVRDRNLQMNLAALDLAAEGLVRSLSVLQEDSEPFGLHKKDQRVILQRMQEKHIHNAYLRNGTDEAGSLSAAKALWGDRAPLEAQILYFGQSDFVAPCEDRPFLENMENACLEIGITESEHSNVVICVCCPRDGEQETAEHPAPAEYLQECAREINLLLEQGKQVYLLDITRVNGGCLSLVSSIRNMDELCGYSAWNTASNSMGTLLAQVLTDTLRGESNRQYFQERLLDDLLYQGAIRPILQKQLRDLGEDIYALKDPQQAETMLRAIYAQELPKLWPLKELPNYRVSHPWPRTFEIKAESLPVEEA